MKTLSASSSLIRATDASESVRAAEERRKCCGISHKHMPVVVGAVSPRVEIDDPRGRRSVHVVEQQQLRPGAVLGEHAEIGAAFDQRRSQREALPSLANHGLCGPTLRVSYDLLLCIIQNRPQVPLVPEALYVDLVDSFGA